MGIYKGCYRGSGASLLVFSYWPFSLSFWGALCLARSVARPGILPCHCSFLEERFSAVDSLAFLEACRQTLGDHVRSCNTWRSCCCPNTSSVPLTSSYMSHCALLSVVHASTSVFSLSVTWHSDLSPLHTPCLLVSMMLTNSHSRACSLPWVL